MPCQITIRSHKYASNYDMSVQTMVLNIAKSPRQFLYQCYLIIKYKDMVLTGNIVKFNMYLINYFIYKAIFCIVKMSLLFIEIIEI